MTKVLVVITMIYSFISLKIIVRGNHPNLKIPPPYLTYFDPKLDILCSKISVGYIKWGYIIPYN